LKALFPFDQLVTGLSSKQALEIAYGSPHFNDDIQTETLGKRMSLAFGRSKVTI